MLKLKEIKLHAYLVFPVICGLLFSWLINGWAILTGGFAANLKFLNILNNEPKEHFPEYFFTIFLAVGLLHVLAAIFLVVGLIRREFLAKEVPCFLKWGLLLGIVSLALFGYMTRVVSNHAGSANLYFYGTFLYFVLGYLEKQKTSVSPGVFDKLKIIPIYFVLCYTMGFPGWQKLFNSAEVMVRYVNMFRETFLAELPGGVIPFIYFLGLLEIAVPVLLLLSLLKQEFSLSKQPLFLNLALFVSVSTFIMLSFGLGLLMIYPGATNLLFYAMLTLGLYVYINKQYR